MQGGHCIKSNVKTVNPQHRISQCCDPVRMQLTCKALAMSRRSVQYNYLARTTMNAIESPLLRLPAEIRDAIWTYLLYTKTSEPDESSSLAARAHDEYLLEAYHFDPTNCHLEEPESQNGIFKINICGFAGPQGIEPNTSRHYRLRYSTCGPGTGKICSHIAHAQRGAHGVLKQHCEEPHPLPHPLVCKQFWAETTDLLFKNSSWIFHNQEDLRLLVSSKQACVPRIQKMVINCGIVTDIVDFCEKWNRGLTWRWMRHFKSLKYVDIDIALYVDLQGLGEQVDLLNNATWVDAKLPLMIQSLQQHQLEEVSVRNTSRLWDNENADWRLWGNAVRELILTHVPLRDLVSEEEIELEVRHDWTSH
jgi:hypothetical protein